MFKISSCFCIINSFSLYLRRPLWRGSNPDKGLRLGGSLFFIKKLKIRVKRENLNSQDTYRDLAIFSSVIGLKS